MKQINPMCFDCTKHGNECKGTEVMAYTGCLFKVQDESKRGMRYVERNPLWNLNSKIRAKFSRLNHIPADVIYVGMLPNATGWTSSPEGVVYYSYDMNERTYDGGISYTTKDGGGYSFTDTLEAFKSYAEQSINLITSKEVAPVEENAKSIKRYTSVTKEGRAVLVLENASVSTDEMVDKWNTIHWPNGSCTVYGDAINKFKALEDAEAAHNEKIKELLSLYEGNKEDLKTISQHIQEHGCLVNGLSDVSDTFEQGYNNALERVFHVLGVRY